ncbi:MAG: CHAT domain-containing protein [Pseudonocardiaceae bacterium]
MAHDRWFDAAWATLNDALSGGVHRTRVSAAAWDRYRRSGELSVLDEAITAYRRAVAATPPKHPDRGCRLSDLGSALTERFKRTGERWALDTAVNIHQQAVKATPEEHAHRQQHLSRLLTALRRRLQVTDETAILDDIITAQRQLADVCSDNADRAHRLNELGDLHWDRFQRTGELSSLTAAVETYRIATEPPLHRHADQVAHLIHRATALAALVERAGEPELLDEMVSVRRQLVDHTPQTVPEHQARLADLTGALWARYRQDAQPALREELFAIFQQVATEKPVDHLHPGCQLSNMAVMLTDKLGESADPALLAEIVDLHRQAVTATPVDHPHRLRLLGMLGRALDRYYQQSGDTTVLGEVIDVCRELVDGTSPDNPDRLNYLVDLSRLLLDLHQGPEGDGMLEEIIVVHRDLTAALPKDNPDRPRHLSNLGSVLLNRFWRSRDDALLDPIIDVFRQALTVMPASNPQRPKVLSNLGAALVEQATRADPSEQQSRWQEAVVVLRAGADALPTDDSDWPLVRGNLGTVLKQKFEQLNDPADLREAVEVFRHAVETTPVESPHWLTCLAKLADASLARAEQPDSPAELLDEAITTQRWLLDATPNDQPERMNHTGRLAGALRFRYHRFGDRDALEEAISIHRALVEAIPPDHPGRRCALHNLGNALRVRDVAADHPAGVADETLEILRKAAGFPSPNLEQTILPITIYLSDELAHEQVEAAIEDLLAIAGGHIERRDDPVLGSWFRRVWGRICRAAHSPWAHEATIVATHAAESRLVHAQDATVTATLMQNLGPVIAALQPTEEAVIRLGALLLVKIADKPLVVLQLTSAQQLALDHQPQLAKSPHDILSALELQSDGNALQTNDMAGAAEETPEIPQEAVDPRHYAQHLSDLVEALGIRGTHTGELPAIDEMIRVLRLLTGGFDDDARHLRNLGSALLTYQSHVGGVERLDEAIEILRQAVKATAADHADRPSCLALLGEGLHRRYQSSRAVAHLNEALDMLREAIEGTSGHDPQCCHLLSLFVRALQDRYSLGGDRSLLEQAVTACRQAAGLPSTGTLDRCRLLDDLGDVLLRLARHTDELVTFRKAVWAYRQAVDATPADHHERAHHLCGLGGALIALTERSGEASLLEEAITILRQASNAAPAGHPYQVVSLVNLSSALHASYRSSGVQAQLDEAISIGEQAAKLSGEFTVPTLARYNLGGELLGRCRDNADASALDDAIRYALRALEELPSDHVDRGERLTDLGNKLLSNYECTGKPDLLTDAITCYRQAISATPTDHAHLADIRNKLGVALLWHYDRTGELGRLDEAISLLQEAVDATPAQHPRRPERLTHLGLVLESRYHRTGDQKDLTEALKRQQEAVRAGQSHHRERVTYMNNLGNVSMSLFRSTGELARLDRSIHAYRDACAACPAGHRLHACLHANLSLALRARYRQTGRPAVLDEAVEMQRRAVAGTSIDDRHRPVHLAELSAVLLLRHELTGDDRDLVAAAEISRQAVAAAPAATPRGQIDVHAAWGRLAARTGDWRTALDALATAVQLLPRILPAGLHRDDQEHQLAGFAGIASDAAACALQLSERHRAVELLEHSRGVLLKQAMDRGEETELRERDAALADEVARLRAQFACGADVSAEWERLMRGIRAMSGFERFLLPPVMGNLLTDLPDGPVVLINVSRFRSDALALKGGSVQVIRLPALDPDGVRERAISFLAASNDIFETRSRRAQQYIRGTLCWLWEAVAAPVLDALALPIPADPDALPRLWWSPTGLLSLLPLHAAGHHHDQQHDSEDRGSRTVIERVVSSYTPTIQMLRRARRQQQAQPAGRSRMLMVSVPNAPGADRLRWAQQEMSAALGMSNVRFLSDGDATRQEVMAAIPAYQWVHFACHGYTDLTRPSNSYLVLQDHTEQRLTVQDISGLRLRGGQLVFLSACGAARTSGDLADEAIHLASSFQIAGYPHVVAPLWSVNDRYANQVTKMFYDALANQNCIATAVHRATRELRQSSLNEPWWWGAHIHMGP